MSTLLSNIRLAPTTTAVSCARIFTAHTLRTWGLPDLVQDAELVVSELVTNAVRACGVLSPVPTWGELEGMQLLHLGIYGHGQSVNIQVWDSSLKPPIKPEAGGDDWTEHGRGLTIVEALALHVGHFFPNTGGKVVWAELSAKEGLQPLPRRVAKELENVLLPLPDPDLLLRLLDALQRL
ncbi:ATP-binding protein [Streptomyces iakyrus]|uniref:ATP-binding protein n=1 Tax=Streptomyces iakyrus TaxID=68219 RepID=UPI0036F17BB9